MFHYFLTFTLLHVIIGIDNFRNLILFQLSQKSVITLICDNARVKTLSLQFFFYRTLLKFYIYIYIYIYKSFENIEFLKENFLCLRKFPNI